MAGRRGALREGGLMVADEPREPRVSLDIPAGGVPPTVYIVVGNGGSLTQDDLTVAMAAQQRGEARVIVINDVFQWAPKAWALYGADYRWWRASWSNIVRTFLGRKFSVDEMAVADYGLEFVHCEDLHAPKPGIAASKDSVRHGYSSGFQAVHLARNLGAKKIILLGFDYGATGNSHAAQAIYAHAAPSSFDIMIKAFDAAAPAYHNDGVQVINASRETALTCFPRMTLQEALDASAS